MGITKEFYLDFQNLYFENQEFNITDILESPLSIGAFSDKHVTMHYNFKNITVVNSYGSGVFNVFGLSGASNEDIVMEDIVMRNIYSRTNIFLVGGGNNVRLSNIQLYNCSTHGNFVAKIIGKNTTIKDFYISEASVNTGYAREVINIVSVFSIDPHRSLLPTVLWTSETLRL